VRAVWPGAHCAAVKVLLVTCDAGRDCSWYLRSDWPQLTRSSQRRGTGSQRGHTHTRIQLMWSLFANQTTQNRNAARSYVIINGGPGAISTADNFHCQSDCQFSTTGLVVWLRPSGGRGAGCGCNYCSGSPRPAGHAAHWSLFFPPEGKLPWCGCTKQNSKLIYTLLHCYCGRFLII
jgi:hypothetical protein